MLRSTVVFNYPAPLSDRRFTAFGLSPHETAEIRQRFATWPRPGDAGRG